MQTVRYQVFVSSTFTDLQQERAEVIQALWEMDCIPTGMEAFVASNEEQWKVIQRVIDDSDYYVLIIGGRYGQVTDEGISYTEKEYRYAKKIGLPVLAFVHGKIDEIAAGKSEKDATLRQKLEAFRTSVMTDHPIRKWTTPAELGGVVSRSVLREIKITQRPGWVRNNANSPVSLLEKVNALSEENKLLREASKINSLSFDSDSLENGIDETEISGTRSIYIELYGEMDEQAWSVNLSWDYIWSRLGPATINEASETQLRILAKQFNELVPAKNGSIQIAELSPDSWNKILIQLRALGFIKQGTKKRAVDDRDSYWKITERGDQYLINQLAIRKPRV